MDCRTSLADRKTRSRKRDEGLLLFKLEEENLLTIQPMDIGCHMYQEFIQTTKTRCVFYISLPLQHTIGPNKCISKESSTVRTRLSEAKGELE